MTLPKKALGVLLHSSPATDRSTQVGKEEVEGNAKWKPNAQHHINSSMQTTND